MTSWTNVELGSLCRPRQWPTIAKSQMATSGFPVYGANGQIGFSQTYTHEEPTILVGCRGSCGTVHITVPRSYATGNAMALDDLDTSRITKAFLAHYLRFRGFRDVTTGSSQPQIIASNLVRVRVPVPPLAEQDRIAGQLDAAVQLRSMRLRALQLTDQIEAATFRAMIGTPAANPHRHPTRPLGDLIEALVWQVSTLGGDRDVRHVPSVWWQWRLGPHEPVPVRRCPDRHWASRSPMRVCARSPGAQLDH